MKQLSLAPLCRIIVEKMARTRVSSQLAALAALVALFSHAAGVNFSGSFATITNSNRNARIDGKSGSAAFIVSTSSVRLSSLPSAPVFVRLLVSISANPKIFFGKYVFVSFSIRFVCKLCRLSPTQSRSRILIVAPKWCRFKLHWRTDTKTLYHPHI